jgi:hypothetical protein
MEAPMTAPSTDDQVRALLQLAQSAVDTARDNLAKATELLAGPATPPPAAPITLSAPVVTSDSVTIHWACAAGYHPTGFTAGRNGVDSTGYGDWTSGPLAASVDSQPFRQLLPSTAYTFTVTPAGGTPVKLVVTTAAAGSQPPVQPPTSGDGIQAAVLQGWGKVIDGDEFFDYTGAPDPARWGVYDSTGHAGNGKRTPKAWRVADGVCTCTGDAAVNSGGMAFKRWEGKLYRVEVRTKIVQLPGSGEQYHPVALMWPSIDKDWPKNGEDDFAETNVGSGRMECFLHHLRQTDGGAQFEASMDVNLGVAHNWAIERTGSAVTGWCDGVQWFRTTDPAVLNLPLPMHLCLQLDAMSPRAKQPAQLVIEWARIYTPPAA